MSKTNSNEHVYLPNEIFADLQKAIDSSRQIAFAYSYIYYITYLYRYCRFLDENGEKVTQERIKEYLGYSPSNKKVNYIIKMGGILDTIGYTETTTDYPIQYLYEEVEDSEILIFETASDFKGIIHKNNRNFKIKKPIKSFYRSIEDIDDKDLTGTFYYVENTHRIDFKTFDYIASTNDLGVVALYIYGYLKCKNNIFKSGYQRSSEKLGQELGMSDKTVRKYVDFLEDYGLISIERKDYDYNSDEDDDHEANVYHIL